MSFLAAELVGENGRILGVDRSAAAVDRARASAIRRNYSNVAFVVGDPAAMRFDKPFDAIVGRFVLMYQDDPAVSLGKITRHLRPAAWWYFKRLIRAHAAPVQRFLLLTRQRGGLEKGCAAAVPEPNSG